MTLSLRPNLRRPEFFLVTPWYGTFAGGGGRALSTLADMLLKCGFPTTMLTTCSKSPYQDWRAVSVPAGESEVNGVRVLRFPVDQSNPDLYHEAVSARGRGEEVSEELQNAFFDLGLNSKELVRYVGTLPTDAVIIAGTYFQSLVPSVINANPGRVVALPAFHDEPEFYWAPIGRLVKNARQILFLSDEEKDLAIRVYGTIGGRKLVEAPVVGLGTELSEVTERALHDHRALENTVTQFNLPSEYLVYVGRVEPAKGLSYLMPWMISLNQRRIANGQSTIPLVLVGDGPADVVPHSPFLIPLGYRSEEEKIAVIKFATALVNPSTLESFSYVVMEAWLTGTPVLVPKKCAVTSGHVDRCGGGFVFDDEHDFCGKVDILIVREARDAMAKRGRQYVRGGFRWPDVMDRILRAVLA
jgi:glycosyltransferase involved in cell wall biosynthesis